MTGRTCSLHAMSHTVGQRAPQRWLRATLLALGAAVLAAGLAGIAVAHGRSDGTAARTFANAPVAAVPGQRPHLWWAVLPFGSVGAAPISLVGIADADGSLLPPGTARLPGPGEALLSPQLRADLGEHHDRYGRDVGSIDPEALETPTERRAYIGLAKRPAHAIPAVAFGSYGQIMTGALYQPQEWMILLSVVMTLVLSGLTALFVASRTSAQARRSLVRLAGLAGAGPGARWALTIGMDLVPLAMGALFGAGLTGVLLLTDVAVPTTATVLSSQDARSLRWAVPLACIVTVLLGLGVSRAAETTLFRGRSRPRMDHTSVFAMSAAALFVLLRPLVSLAPSDETLLVFLVVVSVCTALLPFLVGDLLALCGRCLAPLARRVGLPGTLVAARQLAAHPRDVATATAPAVVATVVLTIAVLWGGVLSGQAAAARESASSAGGRIAVVSLRGGADSELVTVLHNPGPGAGSLAVTHSSDTDTVVGTCSTLRSVGLDCRAGAQSFPAHPSLARALRPWVTQTVMVRPRGIEPSDLIAGGEVYVVSDRGPVDLDRLTRSILAADPTGAAVEPIGQMWEVAASTSATQARWLTVLGMVSLMTLVLAFGLGSAASLADQVRSSTAVVRWSERRAPLAALAWWRFVVPHLCGFIVALGASAWFALAAQEQDPRFSLPPSFLLSVAVGGLLLAVLLGCVGFAVMQRSG